VDGRVNHHPCAAPELGVGRDVDEDGLRKGHEGVNDHAAELEHLCGWTFMDIGWGGVERY